MAPSVATVQAIEEQNPILLAKANGSKVDTFQTVEDYNGKYQFAPIEEAQVSRAMIKRYVDVITELPFKPY